MNRHKLYGAILGDLVGAPYELKPVKSKTFDFNNPNNHYTDDTLMTLATATALLDHTDFTIQYKWWGGRYYGDYYGKIFKEWIKRQDYTANFSYGNGSAMRVAPVGYVGRNLDEVVKFAIQSSISSHTHHEAIKGACAIASAIFMLKNGSSRAIVKTYIKENYYANVDAMIQFEKFKVSCQDTVPVAFACFFNSKGLEEVIRNAVWCGGDCDTIGSMAAELWVAHKGVEDPHHIEMVEKSLDELQLSTLKRFNTTFQ